MRIKSQFTIILLLLLLCPLYLFARTKNFSKQTTEVIPSNQSQDQVVAYLTQKLTREAVEEAGVFVSSELQMENGNISKEEITNIAGAVAQIKVDEIAPFVEKSKQYVRVKVNISVDTDSVQAFLHNTQELTQAKEEAKQLRQRNLELEALLKNANKQQFEQTLSDEVKQQVALQQKHSLEYKQLALKAQENFLQTKQERLKQESQREAEIAQLKQRLSIQQESLALEEKQLKEKFKLLAQQNPVTYTSKMNIQEAFNQASLIQPKLRDLMDDYDRFLAKQQKSISSYFAEQKELQGDFGPKNKWETTQEFQERQQKNKQLEQKIYTQEQEQLFTNEIELLREFTQTSQPIANALSSLQTQGFPKGGERAQLLSMDKVNADKKTFEMKVKYNKKTYTLPYDFSSMDSQTIKILFQQPEQFFIEPLFAVKADKKGNLQQELTAFSVKSLATKREQTISIPNKGRDIPEVLRWESYINRYNDMDEVQNNPLPSIISEFKNSPSLQQYTQIISGLEQANALPKYEKFQHLSSFRNYVKNLEQLDELPVQILTLPKKSSTLSSEREMSLAFLKKSGRIQTIGTSYLEELGSWANISEMFLLYVSTNHWQKKPYVAAHNKDGKLLLAPNDDWTKPFQKQSIKKIITNPNFTCVLFQSGEVKCAQWYGNQWIQDQKLFPALSEKRWKTVDSDIEDVLDYDDKNDSFHSTILTIRRNGIIKKISIWDNKSQNYQPKNNSNPFKKVQITKKEEIEEWFKQHGKDNESGRTELERVRNWRAIKQIVSFYGSLVALMKDGFVLSTDGEGRFKHFEYATNSWKDIIAIDQTTDDGAKVLLGIDQKGRILMDYEWGYQRQPQTIYKGIPDVWTYKP